MREQDTWRDMEIWDVRIDLKAGQRNVSLPASIWLLLGFYSQRKEDMKLFTNNIVKEVEEQKEITLKGAMAQMFTEVQIYFSVRIHMMEREWKSNLFLLFAFSYGLNAIWSWWHLFLADW